MTYKGNCNLSKNSKIYYYCAQGSTNIIIKKEFIIFTKLLIRL